MSVTAAAGFRAAGMVAGIKDSGRPDLALVVNDGPGYAAAGVVTANRVKAAPVLWTERVLRGGELRAVVLNSGSANACTGPEGFADTHRTAEAVAEALGIGAGSVAVCSTGLIGARIPMAPLLAAVNGLVGGLDAGPAAGLAAADAIRTTDTVAKVASVRAGAATVGGMAKGAGMIAPGLATMLCVITTDALAEAAQLDAALRAAVRITFDRLDTDGCMSTNDTVLLLAGGASGIRLAPVALADAVTAVCADLAGQMAADAEGASKRIAITVTGAAGEDDAVEVGRAVARSSLVKCALHGEDPNWGRILAAVGTTRAAFDPLAVDVAINGVTVCRAGGPGDPRELVDLRPRDVAVAVDLHAGDATATILTADLTAAYVHENAAYST